MKKLALILVLVLTVTAGFSQDRKRMQRTDRMTPEQQATLAAKKMALQLDLTDAQIKRVTALQTKMIKERRAKGDQMRKRAEVRKAKMAQIKKESKDRADFKQRVEKAIKAGELDKADGNKRKRMNYNAANNMLDNQIEFQAQMKKILNKEQYDKFKKMQELKAQKMKKNRANATKKRADMKKKMAKKRKANKEKLGKRY